MHGLDATAAQTFGTLFNMLESLGVELVITHMENPEMEKLLRAHGVIGANCCMCAHPAGCTASCVRHYTDMQQLALSFASQEPDHCSPMMAALPVPPPSKCCCVVSALLGDVLALTCSVAPAWLLHAAGPL